MLTVFKGIWMSFTMALVIILGSYGEPTTFMLFTEKLHQAVIAWQP